MKHETIKVGNIIYNIAKGSCSLNDLSGYTSKVAIVIGSNNINDIHKNLMENSTVIKYDADGAEEWTQENLVYTRKSTFDSAFPVGIEQVQETDEKGNTITINKEVLDAVIIVEFRTPSLEDEVKTQKQKISNQSMRISQLSAVTGVCVGDNVSDNPTFEELKEIKKDEINAACGKSVCNGVTVELSTGTEHFSLSQSDQLNLFGLQAQIASGVEQIVYHADGQPCRYYPVADITLLIEKAMFHASYHVTYGNSLKTWVNNCTTNEELQTISYGSDVPEKYQSEVLKTYLAQIASNADKG